MDGLVQALRFLSVSDLAAGNIGAGVHTGRVSAEAIEIHVEIVAGVKAARQSANSRNDAHASVAMTFAGNSPWACRLGVSFFSASLLAPGASVEFLESFLTHLIGFRECELSCAAAAAPVPIRRVRRPRSAFQTGLPPLSSVPVPKNDTPAAK